MSRIRLQARRTISQVLARLFWMGLMLLHVPIFGAVVASMAREGMSLGKVGSAFSLLLAFTFFALKLHDVACLRLRNRTHSIAAFCVITALVHQGTLLPDERADVAEPTMIVVALTIAGGAMLRHRRAWPDLVRFLRAVLTHAGIVTAVAVLEEASRRCAGPATRLASAGPRAPPV